MKSNDPQLTERVDADIEDLLRMKASGREQDIVKWLDQKFRAFVFWDASGGGVVLDSWECLARVRINRPC